MTIVLAAAIGAALVLLPEVYRVISISDRSTFSSTIGGCDEIINNVRTACGYESLLKSAAYSAGLGALAGLVFWHVYRNPAGFSMRWIAGGLAGAALVIAALFYLTADRSCHNMFRDGRTSIAPAVKLELAACASDYDRIGAAIERFAREENLSLRDERIPGARPADFSLCSGDGVNIATSAVRPDVVFVFLYLTNERAEWEPLWRRLRLALSPWLVAENSEQSSKSPRGNA